MCKLSTDPPGNNEFQFVMENHFGWKEVGLLSKIKLAPLKIVFYRQLTMIGSVIICSLFIIIIFLIKGLALTASIKHIICFTEENIFLCYNKTCFKYFSGIIINNDVIATLFFQQFSNVAKSKHLYGTALYR